MSEQFYTYHFSHQELMDLVKFLRNQEADLPESISGFYAFCESSMYENLTLDEAENLFL